MHRLMIAACMCLMALLPGMVRADTPASFMLGPLDQVEINVSNYPDLKTATRVGPEGQIVLPLIGIVSVGGLAPADAAHVIEARYRDGGFIKAPSVRVEVLDYQSRKASVLGQVNAQGLIVLDRNYSVAEIIAKAGGLGAEAADSAVVVRQKLGGGSERIAVDLNQLIAATGTGALMEVRAGDVVFVPKAPTISVIGAVNKAGTYRLTPGMTVQQALAAAGDIARIGTRSRLKIRRALIGGAMQTIPVRTDDLVQPNDVIIVRERLF